MVNQTERAFSKLGVFGADPVTQEEIKGYLSSIESEEKQKDFLKKESREPKKLLFDPVDKTPVDKTESKKPGFLKPKTRPKHLQRIDKLSPIQAVLYDKAISSSARTEAEFKSARTQIVSNLNENIPEQRKTIEGFFKTALGYIWDTDLNKEGKYVKGLSGMQPVDARAKAWCAAFVNHILDKMGADLLDKGPTGFDRIRVKAYVDYGTFVTGPKPTDTSKLKEGDIVVLESGHVAFYTGTRIGNNPNIEGMTSKEGFINILGGNQAPAGYVNSLDGSPQQYAYPEGQEPLRNSIGEVSIKSVPLSSILAVRRITYNDITYEFNEELAKQNPLVFPQFFPKDDVTGFSEGGLETGDAKINSQMQSLMIPSADDDYITNEPKNFTARDFASDSWEETKERFMDAGKIDVDPEDPALFTAYKRSIDYLKDMGLSGLGLADTAFKYAVGSVSQVMPTEQLEKRMARDLYSMPEAFAGMVGLRSLTQLDDAADAFMAGSKQVVAKSTNAVKEATKNISINKALSLGKTDGFIFTGKLNLVHGYNPPKDAQDLAPTFTTSEKYGGERYGEFDGETPGGSYGPTGVYLENPSDPLFFNSPEVTGFYAPKTALVAAEFNKAFILRPDTLKELEKITGINLKNSLPKIEDGNLKGKDWLAEEQGAEISAKLKELGYDGLIVKDFFVGDSEISVYDKYRPLREKIEDRYKKKYGVAIPEKGSKEHQQIQNLFLKENKELEKIYSRVGIHPLLTQPQIIHLKPETLKTEKVFPKSLQSDSSQVDDMIGTQPIKGTKPSSVSSEALTPSNTSFTTSSGSTYNHSGKDSTTVRNRAPRNDNEVSGLQPRSGKTIFMTKEAIDKIGGVFQNTEIPIQLVPLEGNKAKLVYSKDYGPKKAGEDVSGVGIVEFTTTPTKGLHPVEIMSSTNENRRNIHFGNEIIDIKEPQQFAQGGSVMNNQMEMAFMQQGGLKDDGMRQDPVSGNPIPNGSMAEEVRDDIPAQLSEGEYVVPADVVRYYGVKHFEDIRNNAKQGLQGMEKNGRIGGEPVPVGGPKAAPQQMPQQQQMASDLSQEEMNELQSMMMNVGGFVEQPLNIQQPTDPYQQQQTMYQPPVGMDTGGVAHPHPHAATSFSPPYGGFSFEPKSSQPVAQPITQTEQQVDTPQSCTEKGMIYNAIKKTCVDIQTSSSDGDPPKSPEIIPWYKSTDFTAGAKGGTASAAKYFGKGSKIASAIGGVLGGALAGTLGSAVGAYGTQISNISTAKAEVALRMAIGDVKGAEALNAAIESQLSGTPGLQGAYDKVDKFIGADGDMKVIQALKAAGIEVDESLRDDDLNNFMKGLQPSQTSSLAKFLGSTVTSTITPVVKQRTPRVITDKEKADGDKDPFFAPKPKIDAAVKSGSISQDVADNLSINRLGGFADRKGSDFGAGIGAGQGGSNISGPMNKGGLMAKKKRQR